MVFFLESNHQNLNYKYYIVLSMMAIATLFLTIILSILFFKFSNDKNLKKFLLIYIIYFIMVIIFSKLYILFDKILYQYKGEITFIICLSIFMMIFLSSRINKFFIFLSLIIFILSITKIIYIEINKRNLQNKIINNKDIQNLKIKNNKDIYIVLYNAAISLKEFDKIYNLSVEEKFLKNLPQEFIYHQNIKPLSNNSRESIKQIFNFGNISNQNNSKIFLK